MNLFVDTTSKYLIFVLFDKEIIDQNFLQTNNNQAEIFLDELDHFLKKNKCSIENIDNFYFAQGPGSFTGIRVALSFAKALKVSGYPNIYTINSLHLLINNYDDQAIIDARGNKSYYYNNKTKEMAIYPNDELIESNYLTYDNNHLNIPLNLLRIVNEKLYSSKIEATYIKEAF